MLSFFPLKFNLCLYPSLLSPFTPISPVLPHPPSLLLSPCFSNTNSSGPPLTQSPAAPPAVRRAGATGRRANPQTMRSSLSPASKATPAPPPQPNPPPPPPPPPPRWRLTSLVWVGRRWTRPASRLMPPPLLTTTPTPLLVPPRPQTCWGTCLVPRPRRPVQPPHLSPRRTKWRPTGRLPAPRPHQQVISTQRLSCAALFCIKLHLI